MPTYMKLTMLWSAVTVLCAPLVGYTLAEMRVPLMASIYIILAYSMAPMLWVIWNEFFRHRRSR